MTHEPGTAVNDCDGSPMTIVEIRKREPILRMHATLPIAVPQQRAFFRFRRADGSVYGETMFLGPDVVPRYGKLKP